MRARAIAVLALAAAGGATRAATAGGDGARPAVRTHHDAPPAVPAHLRPGLRTLLGSHGPRLSAGVRVGRSAGGRPILATASGNPDAAERVLVVGCIHGTECAGMAAARRVLRGPGGCPPDDAERAEHDVTEVAGVAEESSASAEQVSASTQQTSASAQETAASAQRLAGTAQELNRLVGRFTLVA